MEPTFNRSGVLVSPNVHDCQWTGVWVEGRDVLISATDGTVTVTLRFHEYERFLLENFRESTVILGVILFRAAECLPEGLYNPNEEPQADDVIQRINAGNLLLFHMRTADDGYGTITCVQLSAVADPCAE